MGRFPFVGQSVQRPSTDAEFARLLPPPVGARTTAFAHNLDPAARRVRSMIEADVVLYNGSGAEMTGIGPGSAWIIPGTSPPDRACRPSARRVIGRRKRRPCCCAPCDATLLARLPRPALGRPATRSSGHAQSAPEACCRNEGSPRPQPRAAVAADLTACALRITRRLILPGVRLGWQRARIACLAWSIRARLAALRIRVLGALAITRRNALARVPRLAALRAHSQHLGRSWPRRWRARFERHQLTSGRRRVDRLDDPSQPPQFSA